MIDWRSVPDGALLLVDTAPLIYHLENHEGFGPRFAGLFEASASGRLQLAVSTVSLAEVLTGPYGHGRDALARQIESALREHRVVAFSPEIAVETARLRVRYRLRLPAAVQLATALHVNAWGLVTHDRDFSRVDDVRIIS